MKAVETFLEGLAAARTLFFSKSKINTKLHNILHSLRAKNTQLLTSVTLELLSRQPKPETTVIIKPNNTAEFNIGFACFHGICRPKNLALAVEMFKEGTKENDPEAMLMLSSCYSQGLGVDLDEHVASQWVEKAAAMGCPGALHKQAIQMLRALEFRDTDYVSKLMIYLEPRDIKPTDNIMFHSFNGSVMDLSSPKRSTKKNIDLNMSIRSSGDLSKSLIYPRGEPTKSLKQGISPLKQGISPLRGRGERLNNNDTDNSMIDNLRDQEEEDSLYLQTAVSLLLQAAEAGFIAAKTDLGILFELAMDPEKAIRWFSLAAEEGCPKASNRLGLLYFHGKGTAPSPERAFSLFIAAAKAGDRDANNNAGACLEQGIGTVIKLSGALSYYKCGAELDSAQAMYSLGYLLIRTSVTALEELNSERGLYSSTIDFNRGRDEKIIYSGNGKFAAMHDASISYNKKAFFGGSHRRSEDICLNSMSYEVEDARYSLSATSPPNRGSRASEEKDVRFNSPSRIRASVDNYFNKTTSEAITLSKPLHKPPRPVSLPPSTGRHLTPQIPQQSTELVVPSRMDLKDNDQYESQQMKIESQVREGVKWLRTAAELGVIEARYQLGLVYERGVGCPSDMPSALSQYEYAGRDGHFKAALAAGNILYDMLKKEASLSDDPESYSISKDFKYKRIIEMYRVAASGGSPDGMNSLALLLEEGRGLPGHRPNPQEAASWYMEACMTGFLGASINLGLMLLSNTISEFASVDGEEIYDKVGATLWLTKFSRSVDLPMMIRERLEVILAQLSTQIVSLTDELDTMIQSGVRDRPYENGVKDRSYEDGVRDGLCESGMKDQSYQGTGVWDRPYGSDKSEHLGSEMDQLADQRISKY
eukprot:CAMPEP_0119049084 /NCGR_PEP_ID=MMETSP1177-20130426/62692_1 /TAXON_ID=2985 /ORGANISM="Ochromonas sp, Strain CCMP1899" /LENGTH=873 /DNA_ID=CAMNT_0007025861 /DNA_START=409 /DNA_END=3030 /DNA_ORIENTATION=+